VSANETGLRTDSGSSTRLATTQKRRNLLIGFHFIFGDMDLRKLVFELGNPHF
jgi:hypothetical protein